MNPTRDEIIILARHADLPPECLDALVAVYPLVRAMVARLPAPRARGDEPADVFDPVRFQLGA